VQLVCRGLWEIAGLPQVVVRWLLVKAAQRGVQQPEEVGVEQELPQCRTLGRAQAPECGERPCCV
jgi:hypothetical protein